MNAGRRRPGPLARRHARAQALIFTAAFASVVFAVFAYFVNVTGYRAAAGIALESAARGGALRAVDNPDSDYAYARWYIRTDNAADSTYALARQFAGYTILGASGGSYVTGDYRDLFVTPADAASLDDVFTRDTAPAEGTYAATRDGVDVEIINPAVSGDDPTSYRYLNGAAAGADGDPSGFSCGTAGAYPAGVLSVLDGQCYYRSTVVVRIRISARQLGGGAVTISRALGVSHGTNN